jgi:quercetin dioxygenase-like cupin family protein
VSVAEFLLNGESAADVFLTLKHKTMDLLNNNVKTETGNIINELQVATGAIVSKTLLKGSGGNSSIFAIDAGQQISEHAAPFDVVVVAFDGEIDFSVSGEAFKLSAGQWLVVPANAPHGLFCQKAARIMITMFKKV